MVNGLNARNSRKRKLRSLRPIDAEKGLAQPASTLVPPAREKTKENCCMVSERKKMNRKINVRSGAIAVAVMASAILTVLVTKAVASNPEATGSNPSPHSYLAGYPAPPSAPPAIETAQAPPFQNVQPWYVPPPPTQGAPRQTLTLPQVAPQPSSGPARACPGAHR